MRSKIELLREKASALPPTPGVYLMKNKDGTVIYVGKSRKLSQRVTSYFTGSGHTVKTARMVASVSDFDTILCDSEIEALGLENTLIKKYRPKYNIKLKDAKSYPYIALSGGSYPRLFVTRERKEDGARYYGPYSGMSDAYANADTVRKLFRLPSCKRRFPEEIGKGRPCLYRQLGRCLAPCVPDCTEKEYSEAVSAAAAVLSGNIRSAESDLRARMLSHAEREEFEAAAALRDAIEALGKLGEAQKVLSDASTSVDAWGMCATELGGALALLSIREGKLIRKNEFSFAAAEILSAETAIAFLAEHYEGGADLPKEVLVGFSPDEESLCALSRYLGEKRGRKTPLLHPVRGEKHALCLMAEKNAAEAAQKHAEHTAREEGTLATLASLLSLEVLPERIEVYDISNIGAEHTTAGMIVYEDGRLLRNAYRTFRIREVKNDDPASMHEALARRFAHKDDGDFGPLPDLILLDGGKTQVAAGKQALSEAGLSIPLFGLVKDEHHKTRSLCTESAEIGIAHEQAVFVFLYKLQEEVHRHALRATMGAKGRTMRHSSLEKIDGIGRERARTLLAYFGTLRRIREASEEELSAVRGIPRDTAASVYRHFHPEQSEKEKEP